MSNETSSKIDGRLGLGTLTGIGRHLAAVYAEVVIEDIPQLWLAALQRLDARGAQSPVRDDR